MALSKQWESLRRTTFTPEQHDLIQQTVLDDDFWRKEERVLKITKPIYKMLRFSDTDQPIIGEVYEQMDTMLGTIKDVLSVDPVVCELVPKFVVARWDKMNIPLHCLAYVLVPKYYTNSWLSNPAPGGVKRRKPYVDSEVQQGYLEAIKKMVVDHKEVAVIRLQISDFVSNKGVFSQPQAFIDKSNHDCIVMVASIWLLSRYKDDYEKFKNWDANPEEPNIEEDAATMEKRERVSLLDSEDEIVPISGQLTVVSSGSVPPYSTSSMLGSSSSPPPISQVSPIEQAKAQAQRRIEKARGKRQKK
ncbi:hypothetical protein Acr_02g0007910 [Actinidia rufa]|uniref:Uncharacterized protein n=1 Tax=Actinidia rufa TaxID=165716 RepID=A0A7J0E7U6_9ERIC|nr:hypothetical protein Acr_02g0007910 [Actinidia rufa]